MKDAGYTTGYIGKWHLASGPNRFDEGLDPDYRIFPVSEEHRGGYDYWLAADVLEFTSHAYDGHMFDNDGKPRFFPTNRYGVDAQTDWVEQEHAGVIVYQEAFLYDLENDPHERPNLVADPIWPMSGPTWQNV